MEAAFKLFISIFQRIEYEHRPHELYSNGWYETGIESCGFVMDTLNYLCGFGAFNKLILGEALAGTEKEPTSLFNRCKEYFISQGNHIDVVLCLTHLEQLSCYQDTKFIDWLDALMVRLHNHSNMRSHFPVIIECQSNEEVRKIQKIGRFLPDNPTVLEIQGYFISLINQTNLPLIF